MAIYHCSLRIFSRAEGHSAVAAAAYRAGAVLKDQRTGRIHRYGKRKGVLDAFILAPSSIPQKLLDRAVLWNAAEEAETRKNSRVAREVILALPHELSDTDRQSLCRDMAGWLVERYRVAVDTAIHSPVQGDGHDGRNHHAHLLFTTRELGPDGLGKKTRILDDKEQGPRQVELIREVWETLANDALSRAGLDGVQIDRRTLEDQGIDRIPQTHIGPEAKASEETEKDEEEEEGKGKQEGKSGSNTSLPPKTATKQPESKKREVDYKAIDQGRRRSDFVEEIKRLNERRAAFSSIPLKDQIADIEKLIEKLDARVHKLETLKDKTSLGHRIATSFTKLVELSKDLILGREAYRGAVTLSGTERATRAERQREHYGREYRTGLHEQIKTMRSSLDRLEQLKNSYAAYKNFVEKIEKEIAATQPPMTSLYKEQTKPSSSREVPTKIITSTELSIKLALKAEMVRELISSEYKPKAPETEPVLSFKNELNRVAAEPSSQQNLSRAFKAQEQEQDIASYKQPIKLEIKKLNEAIEERQQPPALKQGPRTEPLPDLSDRKNWFIPASERIRPLQESIDKMMTAQHRGISASSPASADPGMAKGQFQTQAEAELLPPRITHEESRKSIRTEAQNKREAVPPQCRAEPYDRPSVQQTKDKPADTLLRKEFYAQADHTHATGEALEKQSTTETRTSKMSQGFNAVSLNGKAKPKPKKYEEDFNMEASPDL